MKNLVAVFREQDKLANAISELTKEGIQSKSGNDGGLERLENGYPHAFQIYQLFVEDSDFANAVSLLEVQTPRGTTVLGPKCNSYRVGCDVGPFFGAPEPSGFEALAV